MLLTNVFFFRAFKNMALLAAGAVAAFNYVTHNFNSCKMNLIVNLKQTEKGLA